MKYSNQTRYFAPGDTCFGEQTRRCEYGHRFTEPRYYRLAHATRHEPEEGLDVCPECGTENFAEPSANFKGTRK